MSETLIQRIALRNATHIKLQKTSTTKDHHADWTKRPWSAEIKLPNVRTKNVIASICTCEQVAQGYNATAIYFGKLNKQSPLKCKDFLDPTISRFSEKNLIRKGLAKLPPAHNDHFLVRKKRALLQNFWSRV